MMWAKKGRPLRARWPSVRMGFAEESCGNSYFDNMETFFGGNGYEIVDQKQYAPDEITFQNIWGVSDEDSYAKAPCRRANRGGA